MDGPVTFRKMETSSFGTGSDAAAGAGYPSLDAPKPSDVAAVKPEDAMKQMRALVESGAVTPEALKILEGVIKHFEK